MTPLPQTAVKVGDDEITVDAAVLAPRLGLTVEALKQHMGEGRVTSVSETGVDEDAGRARLTFRYGARIWRVVIEADGSLIEDPVPGAKGPRAADPFHLANLVKDGP